MIPIQFLFSPKYLILQVFLIISYTRTARSFRLSSEYLEISMSSCQSCLRMRSRVREDLLSEERIQYWLMFLWKSVQEEVFFIDIIEEWNIIIPKLYLQQQYPIKAITVMAGTIAIIPCILFIIYNYKAMNTENYVNHQLNSSKTKEAHQFSKANRFPKSTRITTEVIYTLPPATSNRTTSFGYGSKVDLAIKTSSPPPGSYNLSSEFQKKDLNNTTSIHEGREKVTFGSFILDALKRNREVPSPDKYNIPSIRKSIGGRMGERIKTQFDAKEKAFIPGPGAYKLNGTEIGHKGSYILSTIKNASSPRYYSDFSLDKTKIKNNKPLPQPSYNIQEKEVGKYYVSKFKSIMTCSFSKSERPGLEDRSKKQFPGFKYRRFSEFGN